MNVLLTGATGYVGKQVAEKLTAGGHNVTGLVRSEAKARELGAAGMGAVLGDLSAPLTVLEAAKRVDAVVHTAFDHGGDFFDQVEVEQRFIDTLLAGLGSGKTLVATSAAGVLGDTGDEPVMEDAPLPPVADWPVAKRGALETKLSAADDLRTIVLRLPVLVYGDGGSQFPPMLIQTAKARGVSYYVGEGNNKISAAHVADIAELYVLALENAPSGSLYNVAAEALKTKELAEAVMEAAEVDATESLSVEQAGEIWNPFTTLLLSVNFQMSGEKAKRQLGWSPQRVSLLEDLTSGSYANRKG